MGLFLLQVFLTALHFVLEFTMFINKLYKEINLCGGFAVCSTAVCEIKKREILIVMALDACFGMPVFLIKRA